MASSVFCCFFRIAFPRTLAAMQEKYELTFDQVSRFLKCMCVYLDNTWKHLVIDNLDYWEPYFFDMNRCFCEKYKEKNGVDQVPARWRRVAALSDGTKRRMPKGAKVNYSGHKKFYALSFLRTTGMNGIILDLFGGRPGRHVDHMLQNDSQLSDRLMRAQQGNDIIYKSGTDKGLHSQECVVRCTMCGGPPPIRLLKMSKCPQCASPTNGTLVMSS